jgi:hypothetical protein
MNDGFPFEMRLLLSKRFPPTISDIRFGRYTIRAIPSHSSDAGDAVLSFTNAYKASEGGGSHPEEEANNVCRLLSVFLNVRLQSAGIRVNATDVPEPHHHNLYPQFLGQIEFSNIEHDLERVLTLNHDLARQFLRACHAYSFALEFIPPDPTFAFFLLVVAIECMSSQDAVIPHAELHPEGKTCERFCHFIDSCLPNDSRGNDEQDSPLFRELLKTVYYSHRSGFVHGGREVSSAALMADCAGSSYFKHEMNGKEVKTPGLGWFASIVRAALLGWLRNNPIQQSDMDEDLLSRLAFEKAGLRVKAKKTLEQDTVDMFDDIEYR